MITWQTSNHPKIVSSLWRLYWFAIHGKLHEIIMIVQNIFSWQISTMTNSLSSVQPTAPSHLAVQRTLEGYKCTWQSGYEHHPYLTEFHYQLCFYKYPGDKGEVKYIVIEVMLQCLVQVNGCLINCFLDFLFLRCFVCPLKTNLF
jgi:hypothetical protein